MCSQSNMSCNVRYVVIQALLIRILILLSCLSFIHSIPTQAQKLHFGATAGTGVVASSHKNLLSFNKEIGITALYTPNASPFELQANAFWCRRSIRGVFAFYSKRGTTGFYAFRPVYNCYENSIQVNYRFKESHEKVRKLRLESGIIFTATQN